MKSKKKLLRDMAPLFLLVLVLAGASLAAPAEPLWSLAEKERSALVDTLKDLVSIESVHERLLVVRCSIGLSYFVPWKIRWT